MRKIYRFIRHTAGRGIRFAKRVTLVAVRRTGGVWKKIKRHIHPQKLCLVMCVYNEEVNLPLFLKHILPYVDYIVALDDGSTDRTKEILRASGKLRHLIENPRKDEIGDWNEICNRETLLKKAKESGADWVIAADPDERFEKRFLTDLRDIIESSQKDTVYGVRFRELWDACDQYRADGIWGKKERFCLFPLNRELSYEIGRQKLHCRWYPDSLVGHEQLLDYNIYHLKMVKRAEREKRAQLYNDLDPNKEYQAIGYDYLTDETGILLEKIPVDRQYEISTVPSDYL